MKPEKMKDAASLFITKSGGASFIRRRPLFSSDSRFLFCACENEIKVYSTSSGECVQKLAGHTDQVTGVAPHPTIKLKILSSSLDGTLREWDFEDGVLLRTCVVGQPLHSLFTHTKHPDYAYVILNKDGQYHLSRLQVKDIESRKNDNTSEKTVETEFLLKGISEPLSKSLGFMSSGHHIVCRIKQGIAVVNTKHPQNPLKKYLHTEDGEITCITTHPTDNCCVTGHSSGKIKFWHNVYLTKPKKNDSSKESRLVISAQHWHKDCVKDVCFTPGGSSVLSVGSEGVLVQWQYSESGNKKNFFPRLGAPMRHIIVSDDGALFATTQLDNSILIINNFFTIRATLEGFTAAKSLKQSESTLLPCGIDYDWRTQSCVTNGKPGHLLFYQPYSDEQLYNLDIVHQNYVIADMAETKVTKLTQVAMSPKNTYETELVKGKHAFCTWMATVEERDDGLTTREQKLKIWVFEETEQWWKLNTVVNDPHDLPVTRIVFRPYSNVGVIHPALLSTGLDGMAKIWTIVEDGYNQDTSPFWRCEAVASYRQIKALDGDFSEDGSLAAIAFDHTVCLSDPEIIENLTVLFPVPKCESIERLLFGRCSCQHILMMHTSNQMYACNLLNGGIMWMADVRVSSLIRDPLSEFMAVFTVDQKLHVFRPSDHLPVYTQAKVCKAKVLAAGFIPYCKTRRKSWIGSGVDIDWLKKSRIFFISEKMCVHTICTASELEHRQNLSKAAKASVTNLDSINTPLASVLSKSHSKVENGDTEDEITTTTLPDKMMLGALKEITDTPSHVLPPVSTLCQTFLSSLLLHKENMTRSTGFLRNDDVMHLDEQDNEKEIFDATFRSSTSDMSKCLSKISPNSFQWASDVFST